MKYITRLYSEILNEIRQAKTKEEKLNLLKENKSEDLMLIFKLGYGNHSTPYRNGVPKYIPDDSPHGLSYTNLHNELPRMKFFYDSKSKIFDEKFRDKKLTNILQMLHFSEASLLENIFTQKLDVYGITKELILEAYPELSKEI
jgi:hypothetical protein